MSFKIKVSFLSLLADFIGQDEIIISIPANSKVKDLMEKLILEFGENLKKKILDSSGNLCKYIIFSLNGKDIRPLDGFNTIIQEKDEIFLLPLIAGG